MNLREIANRAKISMATVSRTINRVPTVSPANARCVQRIINEDGYYPNTHARSQVFNRYRIFGLIVSEISNPLLPAIVQTFEDLGFEHKHEILLSSITGNPGRLEMVALCADGVVILTSGREDGFVDAFRGHKVPTGVIDIESSGPLLKCIFIDYRNGIRQAVQHLAAPGHLPIAFISGPSDLKTTVYRKVAFQECVFRKSTGRVSLLVHKTTGLRRRRQNEAVCNISVAVRGFLQRAGAG